MKAPFIYKFMSYKNTFYVYDVNTNHFIKVDSLIYDMIDDWGVLSVNDIISKWRNKYPVEEVKKAIHIIDSFTKKGYFSNYRPKKMWRPEFREKFEDTFNSNISLLILNITERCNLRCRYCGYSGTYYYERTHTERSMSDEVIKKSLNFFLSVPYKPERKCISFYGGEPLLEIKKIKNIVEYISEKTKDKYYFSMTTNGTLLIEEVIRFLVKNGFDLLISLDGPDWIHDKYRVDQKGNPTFKKIIRNLATIKNLDSKYYEKIGFSVVLTPSSSPLELDEFFENFDLVKGRTLQVHSIDPFDTEFFQIYGNYPEEYYNEINELKKRYIKARVRGKEPTNFQKALFERILIGIHKRPVNKLGDIAPANGICMPGIRRLFVSVDGKFYPCERIGESEAFIIGNADEGINFSKLKVLILNYIENSEKECLDCWAVRLCNLCYGSTKKGHFINFERKKEYCNMHKRNLEEAFKTYATIMEENPNAFNFAKNINII